MKKSNKSRISLYEPIIDKLEKSTERVHGTSSNIPRSSEKPGSLDEFGRFLRQIKTCPPTLQGQS